MNSDDADPNGPDVPAAAAVLATAFADDPLMTYFWPNADRRRRHLPHFWAWRVRSRHRDGIVDVARDHSNRMVAVALWETPTTASPPLEPRTLIKTLGTAIPRALAAAAQMGNARPAEPHFYLAAIGTLPAARGQNHATQLIRTRLADTNDTCFLIATHPKNRPFYEHLGFVQNQEIKIKRGPTVYPMSLDPA
ncbi:GNAT family N-acetyltransferase [Nocardia wallacei]|uniref:N-acetyltransferase n=1 Tax=Nocardia wallacei TaxID=480035 RepID=A0A7G1KPG1_9NOCA|nr:GNAT family N-acetyltransferase [Nocardia wallacei]BCK56123.1 N-acetyltransferase [Nocardia wallacei]